MSNDSSARGVGFAAALSARAMVAREYNNAPKGSRKARLQWHIRSQIRTRLGSSEAQAGTGLARSCRRGKLPCRRSRR